MPPCPVCSAAVDCTAAFCSTPQIENSTTRHESSLRIRCFHCQLKSHCADCYSFKTNVQSIISVIMISKVRLLELFIAMDLIHTFSWAQCVRNIITMVTSIYQTPCQRDTNWDKRVRKASGCHTAQPSDGFFTCITCLHLSLTTPSATTTNAAWRYQADTKRSSSSCERWHALTDFVDQQRPPAAYRRLTAVCWSSPGRPVGQVLLQVAGCNLISCFLRVVLFVQSRARLAELTADVTRQESLIGFTWAPLGKGLD